MGNHKCAGPCLEHCYSKNNIIYLFIGVIIGIIIVKIYYINKERNNKQNI